jgi:hypothetical protein
MSQRGDSAETGTLYDDPGSCERSHPHKCAPDPWCDESPESVYLNSAANRNRPYLDCRAPAAGPTTTPSWTPAHSAVANGGFRQRQSVQRSAQNSKPLSRTQISLAQNVRPETGSWSVDLANITARAQRKCLIREIPRGVLIFLAFGMSEFPVQLRWSQFVSVLRKLGYNPMKPSRGSKKVFFDPTRTPTRIMFREPHPPATHFTRPHCTIRFASLDSALTNSCAYLNDVER